MRILLVSEIEPSPTTASGAMLHRHFEALEAEVTLVSGSHPAFRRSRVMSAILNRLQKLFPTAVNRWMEHYEPAAQCRRCAQSLAGESFDCVVTLAHGRIGLHAWRIGKALDIPVVTIFHDWWSEIYGSHGRFSRKVLEAIEQDFLESHRHSDVSLAVCEGMKRHLGDAGNRTEVLYPIPDPAIAPVDAIPKGPPLRVVYAGSLWHPYGKQLDELVTPEADNPRFSFRIHGDAKYLEPDTVKIWCERNILDGYLFGPAYIDLMTREADVLLAVMGADAPGSIRMQTSFPSKVANYFRTGRAVLIWAPVSSSLGEFCKAIDYPWWVSSLSANPVLEMLESLANDDALYEQSRMDALDVGDRFFNPDTLQSQFTQSLSLK
jgi:hypothetical protein